MRDFDVAIVGAGPAGIAAGIQLVRYGWKVILVERKRPGGLLWNASLVENYPGFPGGIEGAQLVQLMVEQARKTGLDIEEGECRAIDTTSKGFRVEFDEKEGVESRLVLVATGTRPIVASFAGAEQLSPFSLVYEVVDLPEDLSGKNILISGGGEAAFDYALSIVDRGGRAVICYRSNSPKAMPLLVNRCKERRIELLPGVYILSAERSDKSIMVHLSNSSSSIFDNIIAAHGREPELPILPKNNAGIFMVGDVTAGRNRQTAIAVGAGVMAAMEMDMLLRQNPQRGWRSGVKTERRHDQLEEHRMNILEEYGNDVLAKVFVASFGGDEKMVEFVESTQPPFTWKEKWVLIVSPLFGCPIGCQMCDAGGGYGGRLTKDQLMAQIDHLVKRRHPDGIIPVPKFKIQFARMGEPALNPAVLDVLRELPARYDAPGLIPSISTVAPRGNDRFFSELKKVKDQLYHKGRFQLQFSIHSSVEAERDMIIPCKKWTLEEISAYGNDFYEPGDRKVTLNFAVMADRTIEPARMREIFNPEKFLIKLTPLNPTIRGEEGGLGSGFDPERPETAEGLVKGFEEQGFDVILSIGDLEENNIGSNCGQYVQRMRLRQEAMK